MVSYCCCHHKNTVSALWRLYYADRPCSLGSCCFRWPFSKNKKLTDKAKLVSVLKLDYFDKQTLELGFTDNKKFSTFLHCGLPSNHWENNAYTTVRLYRRKPCSLWDALWDVPHGVSHPPSRYGGRGRGGRPESGHSLWIFENAQEPCNVDVHFRRQYNLFPTERGTGIYVSPRRGDLFSRLDINWCSPLTWKQHFCPASQSTNKPDCHHKTCFYCSALLSSHIPEGDVILNAYVTPC